MIYQQRDHKWVYLFEEGQTEMKALLGGKGANMGEMTQAGLPVPPGFTITTEACNAYMAYQNQFPEGMWSQAKAALQDVEAKTGREFGKLKVTAICVDGYLRFRIKKTKKFNKKRRTKP